PTDFRKLIRFAMMCGVRASLSGLMTKMSAMSQVVQLTTTPEEMLLGLVSEGAANSPNQIKQPHFFAFGGVMGTARWLRAVIDGLFHITPNGDKLIVSG